MASFEMASVGLPVFTKPAHTAWLLDLPRQGCYLSLF
jgi:hypothetical protein